MLANAEDARMTLNSRIVRAKPAAQRSTATDQVAPSGIGRTPTVLCATDLSARSGNLERRAALLARRLDARLLLLHVVDAAQPMRVIRRKNALAQMVLDTRVRKLARMGGSARVVVRVGKPYETIASLAEARNVDLIILGPYRSRLGDSILGTTAEYIMRRTSRPVLVVNTAPRGPYRDVLLTAGRSDDFRGVIGLIEQLGLLTRANTSIVQALQPVTGGRLYLAGATEDQVGEYVRYVKLASADELTAHLESLGLSASRFPIIQRVARPFQAIDEAAKGSGSDLVVVGTSRFPRLKRVFLGSVSNEVQRRIARDVLIVPPGAVRRSQVESSKKEASGTRAHA
jgi:nucleotide-binding universal stress UspA family protein